MRLFIAVNFNDTTRGRLIALRDELRSRSAGGKFSLPENLHLTLAFLGECTRVQAASVEAVMDTAEFEPFGARIDRVGRFRRERGDIWWAGVTASKALLTLQSELTVKLIDAGFSLDKRAYKPHITLGREIVTDAGPWNIDPFGENVTAIALMKSERIAGKLTYSAVYERMQQADQLIAKERSKK